MKISRTGITRIVFVFDKFVIKIPRISYGWYYFLLGLCSSIEENKCWQITKSPLLCPIKWCSWGGWILIMERVQICDRWDAIDYPKWEEAGFGGDDKFDNYGWLKGKIVKIDYPNFTDKSRE